MPKLRRVRIASLGHPRARFEDLTLDFRGHDGSATDSTLWLANGGGKSSLLSLFFATVRPHQNQFLGPRSVRERRSLSDYVLPDDHGVVVCEWELDGSEGLFGEQPSRYLTGVFYERESGDTDEAGLRRLFFAALVCDEEPALTLAGLPLGKGSGRTRYTLSGFRHAWQQLRERYPACEVFLTDRQKEWDQQVASRGIDSALFSYQVTMNQREGGASDLFTFEGPDQFVDFLLEMVLSEHVSRQARDQLTTFRDQLIQRRDHLLPEKELCEGLLSRLEPLAKIAHERTDISQRIASVHRRMRKLETSAKQRLERIAAELHEQQAAHEQTLTQAAKYREAAEHQARQAATLRLHAVRQRLSMMQEAHDRQQQMVKHTSNQEKLWYAAIPLTEALAHETDAQKQREKLHEQQREHRPLFERLTEAATRFANALDHRDQRCKQQSRDARASVKAARGEAARLNKQAGEHRTQAATAQTQAQQIRQLLQDANRRHEELVFAEAMGRGETAVSATERLQAELTQHQTTLDKLAQQRAEVREQQTRWRESRERAVQQAAGLHKDLGYAQQALERADADARALAQAPLLLELVEAEEVDLEHALSPIAHKAKRAVRFADEQRVELRAKTAEDQRAVEHLRQFGLLPPSPDVQQLIQHLSEQGITCWSGWVYLRRTVPAHQRRPFIQAHPYLSTGIVVADKDERRVNELLQQALPHLAVPVVSVPAKDFNTQPALDLNVSGPSGDAHFDEHAAAQELEAVEERCTQRRERTATLDQRRQDLQKLIHRLEHHAQTYPQGWRGEQQSRVAQLTADAQEQQAKASEAKEKLHALEQQMAGLDEQDDQAHTARDITERRLESVGRYQREHESKEPARKEQLAAHEATARNHLHDAEACGEQAAQCEQDAEQHNSAARENDQQATRAEAELGQVRYLRADRREPVEAMIDPLRRDYDQLKEQYERVVEADAYQKLAEAREADAGRCRRELRRRIEGGDLSETDVEAAVGQLGSDDSATSRHESAQQARFNAQVEIRQLKNDLDHLYHKVSEAEGQCRRIDAPLDLAGHAELGADEADRKAQAAQNAADADRGRAGTLDERANKLDRECEQLGQRRDQLHNNIDTLQKIVNAHQSLLRRHEVREEAEIDQTPPPQSLETELGRHTDQASGQLNELGARIEELDKRSTEAAHETQRWARRQAFTHLNHSARPWFAETPYAQLEARAEHSIEQLRIRLTTIEKQVDKVNASREIVINAVLSAADEGIRLLEQVSRQSRLPDTLPGAGKPFLSITTEAPENPTERRGLIGELVDELLGSSEIPSGPTLIQRAVRRVARPIRVRVMHPDLRYATHRVSISEMARFSGGERLTCTILLYCTLARLRARQQGQQAISNSVLLLDNPIGTASRQRFLDLQREVGRAMGVQLIYATGVEDLNAVAALPNVLRLRNMRVDQRTGRQLVEHEAAESTSQHHAVQAARVAFADASSRPEPVVELKEDGDPI